MSNTVDVELITPQVEEGFSGALKNEMICWPGRSEGCTKPREWAVFHDAQEASLPFDYLASIYIGTCSAHLALALRRDPSAVNFVRPY